MQPKPIWISYATPDHKRHEIGGLPLGRPNLPRRRTGVLRFDGGLRDRLRPPLSMGVVKTMVEPIIGLLVGAVLAAYLIYTLVFPEKF